MKPTAAALATKPPVASPRVGWWLLLSAGACAVFLAWVGFDIGGARTTMAFDNLAELAAAAGAAVAAARTAVALEGPARRGWLLMGASAGSWALGQAVWSYDALVRGINAPFPSAADAGFLAAIPLAVYAMSTLASARTRRAERARSVVDGLIVATSLFMTSWATVLAPVFSATTDSALAKVLSVAYPVGDIVIATVVTCMLARTRIGRRGPLLLVAAGLLALAFSDSAFAYLTQTSSYSSGISLLDVGWVGGYLLIAAAAAAARFGGGDQDPDTRRRRVRVAAPYVPVAIAALTVATREAVTQHTDRVLTITAVAVGVLVIIRQLLTLVDNADLIEELRTREAQLQHLAFHDPLTGLANRSLFWNRVDHALGRRPGQRRIALLMCDLDGFKDVNDRLGHSHGDALLVEVADRLQRCVRSGDTAARLGGDEFAVLLDGLESPDQAQRVADRILQSLTLAVGGERPVQVSVSIGLCRAMSDSVSADELLRRADGALYRAKNSGKCRVEEDLSLAG